MAMKDGIKYWVNGALDTMEETANYLTKHGMEPEQANRAAKLLTQESVNAALEKNLGNANAAQFTQGLSQDRDALGPNTH